MPWLIRIFVLCFVLILSIGNARAQAWVVKILDASNGLPSSECLAVEEDHQGHLWVGTTAGISRYNGYTFENFFETDRGQHIGKVNTIHEDDRRRLWIGSDAGLFLRYSTGEFLKVGENPTGAQGINAIVVTATYLYGAAEIGPLIIPINELLRDTSHAIALNNFVARNWNASTRLTHVAQANDGTLYFSGIHTVYRYHHGFTKLLETERSHDQIMSLMPIDSTLAYVFCSQEDFYKIKSNSVSKIRPQHAKIELPTKDLFTITRGMGVYQFDAMNEEIQVEIDLHEAGVLWACQSIQSKGMCWIATHDGLVSAKPSFFDNIKFKHLSAYPEVYSMMQTLSGRFLIGSNRGLIYEMLNGKVEQRIDVNPNAEVFGMFEDEQRGIWFATGYEGMVYRPQTQSFNFMPIDGLHNLSTNNFFTVRDRLFVTGDGGITEITRREDGGVALKPYFFKASRTQYATFYDGVAAPDGTVWVAGQEGIARIVKDSLQLYMLDHRGLEVAAMKQDSNDSLWLAINGDGIWKCYFNQENILVVDRKYDRSSGLPTDVFTDILIDDKQNIWISHFRGISVLRSGDTKWRNFDVQDGWPFKNYHHLFLFQDRDQNIWAGCSKGLARLDVSKILGSFNEPHLFTSVSTKGEMIRDGESLSHNRNQVRLNYYAIDFPNQENVRYFYWLEGLQPEWVDAGQNRDITFDNLEPGSFTIHIKATNNKGEQSAVSAFSWTIEKPFWLSWWFISLCLLAGSVAIYFVLKSRERGIRNREQQRKEREIQVLSYNRDLAKSKLIALRSQMNPHFIFNALNSIQQFVLQGNADEANRYLSQFARLQRDILNCSDQDFIFLEKEVEMLKLYLTLEQLRSGHAFQFSISASPEIDLEEIRIPPMLIQPFVENSIWHGLSGKTGEKGVGLKFSIVDHNLLSCIIEDNGVGRAATAGAKKNGSESKGLHLIEERMQLLRQRYNQRFDVVIEDVMDSKDKVCGTRATVTIAIDIA